MDVKLLMQTEVAEVYEPFHEGRGSSSTMPQKRNPISCLYIHSHRRAGAPAQSPRCSRPRSPTTSARPARGRSSGSRCRRSSCSSAGALAQTRLHGRRASRSTPTRMRANLDITKGMIVSEAVMMGLGPHLGRQRAHDLVYDICRKVAATGQPLVELLGAGRRDLQAPHARGARQDVRPGELPRPRRRDGRPGAGAREHRPGASTSLRL